MKKQDIIFAAICGLLVSWLAIDFLGKWGIVFVVIFPLLSVLGLWITGHLGRKAKFIDEAGRFFLVGAFADVIDIKVYQLIILFLPFSIFVKAASFIVATFIKYWQNKYWAFEDPEHKGPQKIIFDKQMAIFFAVTIVGLLLNVVSFYFFGKIKTGLEHRLWIEISIILSALVAAVWNFLGYKFLVFKNNNK